MPVPSVITDLSVIAASNSPAGSDSIGTSLDDYLRSVQAIVKREQSQGAAIASASTTAIGGNIDGNYLHITGTTTITSFGTVAAGISRTVVFDGILTLTNSANLILPGGANITTAAGDVAEFASEGGGIWRCVAYVKAAGVAMIASNNLSELSSPATARSNLGLGSAATLTAGTAANNAVKLNGSAQLPAVDGSLLTGIVSGAPQASTAEILAESAVAKYISPDRLSSSKRAAKAWVNFTSVTTTSAASSFGVSGFTDNGVGDTTINFSPAMTDTNYAVVGMSSCAQGAETTFSVKAAAMGGAPVTKTTSAVRVITTGSGGYRDEACQSIAIFGN